MTDEGRRPSRRESRCDYFRSSIEIAHFERFVEWLSDCFGPPEGSGMKARKTRSLVFGGDAATFISWTPVGEAPESHTSRFIVQISGSAIDLIGQRKLRELVELSVLADGQTRRIDIAVDLVHGQGQQLINQFWTAWQDGKVVGTRNADRMLSMGPDGRVKGDTVYFGVRGKNGSGRCVRVYDKGLQTKLAGEGEWVRFESEYCEDVAQQITVRWLACDAAEEERLAFDAIDVREDPDQRLSRRVRSKWWEDLRGGHEWERISKTRLAPSQTTYVEHMKRAVIPHLLYFAKATGQTLEEVVLSISSEAQPTDERRVKTHIRQIAITMLEGDPVDGWKPQILEPHDVQRVA